MEDYFETDLPDLTGTSLHEILTSRDPLILAALERVAAELASAPDVYATEWDEFGHPHPLY